MEGGNKLKSIKSLKKDELVSILENVLKQHEELKHKVEDKWYVEDSEFGLYVKGVLENYELIEPETIMIRSVYYLELKRRG